MVTTVLRAAMLTAALALLAPAHAEVYRWVDDDGQVHFSDEPREGADAIDVPSPTVVPATPVPDEPDSADGDDTASGPDWQVAIDAPAPEATVRDNSGRVSVAVSVQPGLGPDQSVRLLLDGTPVPGGPFRGGTTELTGVNRGAHELQAVLLSADGEELGRSEPVTFYMHQASRLSPGGGDSS